MFLPQMNDQSAAHQELRQIGEMLADTPRWSPYCEGLSGMERSFTAVLLENQLTHLRQMNEVTKILQIGNFDKYAFPLVRAIYPNLAANELVSVQPMAGPVSLVFYMDYLYGTSKGNISSGLAAFDSRVGPNNTEFYSGDVVPLETPLRSSGSTDTDDFVAVLSALTAGGTPRFVPIRPGTVSITYNETSTGTARAATDDGNGNLIGTGTTGTINYTTGVLTMRATSNAVDDSTVQVSYRYDTEANDNIPELEFQLTASPVVALVRKIKARWSLEAAQNLNALHGMDAEAELVGSMAEVVKFEIDREIINDIYNFASAGEVAWDKSVPAGISYTEHKLSFIDALIDASNMIFSATRRGQANWVVAGVGVCNIIESLPTFAPAPGALNTQSATGIVKLGTLNGRWTIFKDPFLPSAKFIVGFKGTSFLDAGYVYTPYIPLYATPTIILDDFVGRKGLATQYGKKPINAKFYAKGVVLNA